MREGRFAASRSCSVATALAASSARRLSAAWAPIASDTVPTSAAAMARERREMQSCLKFITDQSWSLPPLGSFLVTAEQLGAAELSRALDRFGLWGGSSECRSIALNLRHRNKQTLNLPGRFQQPISLLDT